MKTGYKKGGFFSIGRIAFFLIGIIISLSSSAQFLKSSGKKIVDESNNPVILRGMGLGGWMIQEGYMLKTSSFANTQREIKSKIQNLIGPANTQLFYDAWLANHCTKRDIDSLAAWGFNSVRLPMHYNLYTLPIESEPDFGTNTWLEKGFALTDSLIKWCAANHMYVILDLHAAPGGQGRDEAISDYDPSKSSLWENEQNKSKTIALWKKLAERYANEPWVGGYDLINEPNWNFTPGANQNGCSETSNAPLWNLYKDITAAIRSVDQKHIIITEGNCWGNNHNGYAKWDNNTVVSFHKYWSTNDQGSIQGYLNMSESNNVPLWMGEAGENSNQWFKEAIDLIENNGIGWSWWPLKKVGSVVNPLTVKENSDYTTLLKFWQSGGSVPSVDFATNALMKLTEDLKIQNTTYRKDVIDAMFRQHNNTTAIAYKHTNIPGVINFSDFDLGSNGYAYSDSDIANYQVSTGTSTNWNNGWTYRNDGVDIESNSDSDPSSNGYNVGWTVDGEWMQYTTSIDSSAAYTLSVRYASVLANTKLKIMLDEHDVTPVITLPSTSGLQTWSNASFSDVILSKGKHRLRVIIEKGGMNLNFLSFSLAKKSIDVPFQPVTAETSQQTELININFNKPFDAGTVKSTGFSCTVNGVVASIQSMQLNGVNNYRLTLTVSKPLFDGDEIKLSYTGTDIKATDGSILNPFNNLVVKNNLPIHLAIPGILEAENFSVNSGLVAETCSDLGGGKDMGYTNAGDYLVYDIRVKKTALYSLQVRSACNANAGIIEVQQVSDNGTVLNSTTVNIPVTGGWQQWVTVTASINLVEGVSKLKVKVIQPEFNLNWFKFSETVVSEVSMAEKDKWMLFPNPVNDYLYLEKPNNSSNDNITVTLFSTLGQKTKELKLSGATEVQSVFVGDLAKGLYLVEIQSGNKVWMDKIYVK